jgi:hypothetical protein
VKILLLGPPRQELEDFLRTFDDDVSRTDKKLTKDSQLLEGVGWLVSYGYRHIIRQDVLDLLDQQAINLHISLLPWNRGADPNLWSFLDDTPKGVSIHLIDSGIDTGDIIAQREVANAPDDTLKTSYDRLCIEVEELFKSVWGEIRVGKCRTIRQSGEGSLHRKRDLELVKTLFEQKGWDTPVADLVSKAVIPGLNSPGAGSTGERK